MAAASIAPTPLVFEGQNYWDTLLVECQRQADVINAAVEREGADSGRLVQCRLDRDLHLTKHAPPSTDISLTIDFRSWGPVISVKITGLQSEDFQFSAEEFEIPMARDLDGSVVAIFEEGKSFSPRDLACYLTQNFRRCFPGFTLPCLSLESVR